MKHGQENGFPVTVKENRHPYFEKEIVPAKEVAKAQAVCLRTWTV